MQVSIYVAVVRHGASAKVFFKKTFEWKKFAPPRIGSLMPVQTAQGTINGVVQHVSEEGKAILILAGDCGQEQARYMLGAEGWLEVDNFLA